MRAHVAQDQSIDSTQWSPTHHFERFFPPNPFKYGLLKNTHTTPSGKLVKNVATRDRHPVTPDLIEQHLNGSGAFKAIGYCPGTAEGTSTGLIDLDTKDYPEPGTLDDARRRVLGIAGANEIYLHVERSTSGGYHLHCFSSSLLPYPIIRAALIEIATRADLAKIEVYPSTGRSERAVGDPPVRRRQP